MEPDSNNPDDVDEDGRPISRDRGRENVEAGSVADTDRRLEQRDSGPPATAPNPAALVAAPRAIRPEIIRPQQTQGTPSVAILAQHFDVPQEIATTLREIDSSFLKGDYVFAVDVNAYWKVKYSLDWVVSFIAGQADLKRELRSEVPTFLRDYWSIEDRAEDWDDEIRQKVFMLSKLVKVAGLGTTEKPKPYAAVPADAMSLQVRRDLEPWQVKPDEASVVQVAEIVVQAIQKRRLCVVIIDGSPFMDSPYGSGKSQLLWQVLYWSYRLLQTVPPQPVYVFDGRKDIVFRHDDDRLLRLFGEATHVPWGIDEFDVHFDQREWNKPENRAKVQALQMYRKVGRPIVGACGSIWNNDVRVRTKIATHRCEITKWDDDSYTGEFTLYRKYGPPALQDEKEDLWSKKSLFDGKFSGLNKRQFNFYNACADMALTMENKGGLDAWLRAKPDWLSDQADADLLSMRPVETRPGS